jgi:hypothetical protein
MVKLCNSVAGPDDFCPDLDSTFKIGFFKHEFSQKNYI